MNWLTSKADKSNLFGVVSFNFDKRVFLQFKLSSLPITEIPVQADWAVRGIGVFVETSVLQIPVKSRWGFAS